MELLPTGTTFKASAKMLTFLVRRGRGMAALLAAPPRFAIEPVGVGGYEPRHGPDDPRANVVTAAPPPAAPAGRQASLRNILLNTGWMLGGKGVSAALSLVYLAIVTRALGVEGFGQFTLALGIGQAVAGLCSFQSWQIIVRYGMPHLHAGRDAALARLVRFATLLDVASALFGAVLVAAGVLLLGDRFGWTAAFQAEAVAASILLVLSMHWTPIGILRLHDRFATAELCDALTPIGRFLGALAVWAAGPSVIGFLVVWALAEAITAIAYWIAAVRFGKVRWRLGEPLRWNTLARENEGLIGYTATTNLASSLDLGGKQLAVLLVGLIVAPAAAGGFRLAQQLAQALAKLSQLLARAIFPELVRSRAADAGGNADFDRLLRRTVRMSAVGAGIVFLALLLIGRPVLGLIAGEEFLYVFPVLLVLGTAAAIDFAAVGFEPALIALGRPGLALKLRFVATAVLLALMLILPRWLGSIGAALAILAGSIASYLLLWRIVRARLGRGAPSH
ncbi:MAG: polysaccharide biosynthesis protein [Sphingomonas bacterium]|nr:polysaccharide biosynthesis protein [Sphingomonas bacterium]